jgi:hypothetical protein
MQTIQCKKHKSKFQLPTTEDELLSGMLHDEIEYLCEHRERYPKCRFQGVKN